MEDETKGIVGNEDYNVLVEMTAAGKKRKNVDQKDRKDGSYVWGEEGRTEEDQQRKKIFLMDGPAIIKSTKQSKLRQWSIAEAISAEIVVEVARQVERTRLALCGDEDDLVRNMIEYEGRNQGELLGLGRQLVSGPLSSRKMDADADEGKTTSEIMDTSKPPVSSRRMEKREIIVNGRTRNVLHKSNEWESRRHIIKSTGQETDHNR